jgi:hypothetical protein
MDSFGRHCYGAGKRNWQGLRIRKVFWSLTSRSYSLTTINRNPAKAKAHSLAWPKCRGKETTEWPPDTIKVV